PQAKRRPFVDGKAQTETESHGIARVDGPAILGAPIPLDVAEITDVPVQNRRVTRVNHAQCRLDCPEAGAGGLLSKDEAQFLTVLILQYPAVDLKRAGAGVAFESQASGKIRGTTCIELVLDRPFDIPQPIAFGVIDDIHWRAIERLAFTNTFLGLHVRHFQAELQPIMKGVPDSNGADQGISLDLADVNQTHHQRGNDGEAFNSNHG